LNSGNACYILVGNVLSSGLISKNKNSSVFRNIVSHLVWYWCEIWSVVLKEGYRQRVFEDRVLRETFWAEEAAGNNGLEETA
jgi:hypothetical protein